jgi:hypothetical protein
VGLTSSTSSWLKRRDDGLALSLAGAMALMAPATTAAAHAGDVWSTQPATAHGDASSRYVDMPGVLGGGGCDTDQGEGGMESHVQGEGLRG